MTSIVEWVAQNAVAIVAKEMRAGAFDDAIESAVVSAVRKVPEHRLTRVGFILKGAIEIMDQSDGKVGFSRAKVLASRAVSEFSRDNGGVKFGDPEFGWTGADARILVHEYETDHWEHP